MENVRPLITKVEKTIWAKLYLSGPIEVAKQIIRAECMEQGLCVTVEPTSFIYTGGEEVGYVVGLINYPRFPTDYVSLRLRAEALAERLLRGTYQHSALIMMPDLTAWITTREA